MEWSLWIGAIEWSIGVDFWSGNVGAKKKH